MTANKIGQHAIHHGDCMRVLPTLPECSVDAVVTDPPYGTNEEGKSKRTKRNGNTVRFQIEWDKELPLAWIGHAVPLLRPGGGMMVFTDGRRVGDVWDAMESVGMRPLQCFYWVKPDPPPNPRRNFASAVEVGVFARKPGPALWFGSGWEPNAYESPTAHKRDGAGYQRFHPTQKPIQVMRWLCRLITPPGGTVLDPFMGSGTTLLACQEGGYCGIGIEADEGFFAVAQTRLRASIRQGVLFQSLAQANGTGKSKEQNLLFGAAP